MELFGKQRHFLFGLGAREKILDLCENRNLANLNKLRRQQRYCMADLYQDWQADAGKL